MLCDLHIFSGGVYPPSATSHTISFSISNSFGINLIHFFGGKDGEAERSMACSILRSLFVLFEIGRTKSAIFTKSANFLATQSVNSATFGRGGTKVQVFGKGKCKLIANLSVTLVTALPSFSLSLSPSAPHAQ